MSLTVSQVLQAGYRKLGQLTISKATGGSTTSVVDSTLANKSKDNVWNDGALFIVRDAGGAGAAPENEMQRISAYANATGTFTVDTAFTTSPAAGDRYGYTSPQYPLQQMIDALNDALNAMGDIDLVDTSTLTTTSATTEYTEAVAWKRERPYRVDIQGRTNATSTDNQWNEWVAFEVVPAAPGVAGKIIFSGFQVVGRAIRVWYHGQHPQVNLYSDVISETLSPNLVVQAFVVEALDWQNKRTQGSNPAIITQLNAAKQDLSNMLVATPPTLMKHSPRLLVVGRNDQRTDGDERFHWPFTP